MTGEMGREKQPDSGNLDDVAGAEVMRQNGYGDGDIELVYGYVPMAMSSREWDDAFGTGVIEAEVGNDERTLGGMRR